MENSDGELISKNFSPSTCMSDCLKSYRAWEVQLQNILKQNKNCTSFNLTVELVWNLLFEAEKWV